MLLWIDKEKVGVYNGENEQYMCLFYRGVICLSQCIVYRSLMEIDTKHDRDDSFDENVRQAHCLIMTFQTDFEIKTVNGIEHGYPGDTILHTPGYPAFHRGYPGSKSGWSNDWLYFKSDDIDAVLNETEAPVNVLIHTKNPYFLRNMIREVSNEWLYRQKFWEQRVDLQIKDTLYMLSRVAGESLSGNSAYLTSFSKIREQIAASLDSTWTIQRMADCVGLSKSRFSYIYKSLFGSTPMNDLLDLRLEKAMHMLQTTNVSIAEISAVCGFKSEFYFSSFFKKRVGISPVHYRLNK